MRQWAHDNMKMNQKYGVPQSSSREELHHDLRFRYGALCEHAICAASLCVCWGRQSSWTCCAVEMIAWYIVVKMIDLLYAAVVSDLVLLSCALR